MKYDVYAFIEVNTFYESREIKFFAALDKDEAIEYYKEEFGDKFLKDKSSYLGLHIKCIPNCYAELPGYLKFNIKL
jgi:hypothetical protein